ncbi:MAG TPA: energy-coupling factor transporter transmembrane component T family protein [Candidatus Brocadiaceae bacterium]
MVELTIFHYMHKNSIIHKMDGRIKLACMILLSASVSFTSAKFALATLTIILLATLFIAKLPIMTLLNELRYFAFLIALVFGIRSFSIPGTPIPNFPLRVVTVEGITSGLLFAWRLILIIIICLILTGTTSFSSLRNVIEWFLRPIPFIPAARVAIMVNLTFVLIPLIFDQASEMLNAQKARCIEGRKNPVKRIMFIAFPLLVQTFRCADEMVLAMEARCYSEDRTRAVFTTTINDWFILAFSILVSSIVFFCTR